jgi:hypothetical protein
MNYTENFNLALPSRNSTDVVDIDVLSANFEIIDRVLGALHPIGSIWMSLDETNPATMFGGVWDRIEGAFLLGASDKFPASSVGGEETVTLKIENLPSHTHAQAVMAYGNATAAGGQWTANSTGDHDIKYETQSAGGDIAHNNMPPYLSVYIWRRTA